MRDNFVYKRSLVQKLLESI